MAESCSEDGGGCSDGGGCCSTAPSRRYSLRADLRIEAQLYANELNYVIKDPISLAYFRFRPAECDILKLVQNRNASEVCEAIRTKLQRPAPPVAEVQTFLDRLAGNGLAVYDGGGQGEALLAQQKILAAQKRKSLFGSLLYVKFPGFDPTPVMNRVYPKIRWMYSRWAVAIVLSIIAFAMIYTAINADELVRRIREESLGKFFSVETIFFLWLSIGLAKVLHEFGHGLTCKHYGGECHDMGVLLLCFSPCLYCDATDAWTMPSKWHRMAVSAGGIYIELLIASLAALTWWSTENGVIHNVALAMMTICSLNTFLLNANPLMRYDGYYLLADYLEIPNLRTRASQTLQGWIDTQILGIAPATPVGPLPKGRRAIFFTYAVLAWLYRWVLCASILWFFYRVLKPYGLSNVSLILAVAVGFQLLVLPWGKTLMRVVKESQSSRGVRWPRLAASAVVLGLLAYAAVTIPVSRRVAAAFTVEGRDQHPVQAAVPGRIEAIAAHAGDEVQKGDLLVRLVNPQLDLQIEELAGSIAGMKVTEASHQAAGRTAEAQALREILENAEDQYATLEHQRSLLEVRADCDGRVVPATRSRPPLAASRGFRQLGGWYETPLRPENVGARLELGTHVCDLQPSDELEAVLYVDQAEMPFLAEGQSVRLKLDAYPLETLTGRIREISHQETEEIPHQILVDGGGVVPTVRGADGKNRPYTTLYVVRVSLDPPAEDSEVSAESLRSGCRGRAKVECGQATCWDLAVRKFHQIFFL